MRLGVFSDVHANLHALDAVLAALRAQDVDAYMCAGDMVGYGAFPDECVERVLTLPAVCVAGNHDLMALGELDADRCIPLARSSIEWTRAVLREETRARLAALPRLALTAGVLVAHGSLDDPQEYVTSPERAVGELARAARIHPDARIVVLGHTHADMAVDDRGARLPTRGGAAVELTPGRRVFVNPGAVGQSREPTVAARFAIIDLAAGRITFHGVPYDVTAARAALRERGLPVGTYHLRPAPPWQRAAGRVADGLRAAGVRKPRIARRR